MQAISLDAPVEGWNAFDSLDNMPPTAAVILNNFIPGPGRVDTRLGHIIYEDLGTGEPVDTLASYNTDETSELIACSNGGVWKLDDAEVEVQAFAIGEIHPELFYDNSQWQTENFQKADEDGVLIFSNGVDVTQVYNGTTMIDIVLTGTEPALNLTGEFVLNLAFNTTSNQSPLIDPLSKAVENAWDQGIVVVVSAGKIVPDRMNQLFADWTAKA